MIQVCRNSFQSSKFSQIHPESGVFIFIDSTLKQSEQCCFFLPAMEEWNGGMEFEGGQIWEEEEDEKRESRTERWLTVAALWVVCSRSWSSVGPDGEVLLPSSVNTVCYEPIQPIQHRCPAVTDRELSFLSSDDFSSSRTCQVWLDAVKTDLSFYILLTRQLRQLQHGINPQKSSVYKLCNRTGFYCLASSESTVHIMHIWPCSLCTKGNKE